MKDKLGAILKIVPALLNFLTAVFSGKRAKKELEQAAEGRRKDVEAVEEFDEKAKEIRDRALPDRIDKFWGKNGKSK